MYLSLGSEAVMPVTIVGDFADPLSFLASQRVEQLSSLGLIDVRWYAVQADRTAPIGGRPFGGVAARAAAEVGLAGEHLPAADAAVPNSRAATAAYAEALTDGRAGAVRRALFDAVWVTGRRVDDPNVIRSLVFDAYHPNLTIDVEARIAANRMVVPLPDADPLTGTRRLGLIVSMAGGPLTVAGQDRIDAWRRLWQQHGEPRLPLLLTELGEPLSGRRALAWLTRRLPHTDRDGRLDAAVVTNHASSEQLTPV